MKCRFYSIVLLCLLLSTLLSPANVLAGKPKTRAVVDTAGYTVMLPEKVESVANLWFANTAAMLCLGAGDKLVAVMPNIRSQPWALHFYPKIAELPSAVSNAEELMKIDPDLVVTSTDALASTLNEAGIPAIQLMFTDYDSMKYAFSVLGEALGPEYKTKTDKWSELIDKNLARVAEAVGDIPEAQRPVVYYMQGRGFYSTFGANSIMNAWITAGGGVSASQKINLMGVTANVETILNTNPDVIIIGGVSQHEIYEDLMQAEEWRDINAVKNGRVYTNPMGVFPWDRFSIESAMQILFAVSVIHPDRFQVDLAREAMDFYKEFAGVELTRQQAQYIINGLQPNGEKYPVVTSR